MKRHTPNTFGVFAARRFWAWVGLCALQAMHTAHAADTSPAQQLTHWTAQAGAPAKAERGQALFRGGRGLHHHHRRRAARLPVHGWAAIDGLV